MTARPACLDKSFMVGLFDRADLWHTRAAEMHQFLHSRQIPIVFVDCVMNELFTVLARRCRERNDVGEFARLMDVVGEAIPENSITRLYPHLPRWYKRCQELMKNTLGRLNFHDALIVVAANELDIPAVVSFDHGFDQVSGIIRLESVSTIERWLSVGGS